MDNLSRLNALSNTEFEFQDARPSGVVFDRDPVLFDLDQEISLASDGSSIEVYLEEPINCVEFVNYETAGVELEYEVQVTENATDVDWPITLPSYMTVTKSGNLFTVSGFRRREDWDLVQGTAVWTLPTNYETQRFFLVGRIKYKNSQTLETETVEWEVFDPQFYYLARLLAISSVSASSSVLYSASLDISAQADLAATTATTISPTELTASSDLACDFRIGTTVEFIAGLSVNTSSNFAVNAIRRIDRDLVLDTSLDVDLTPAPFTVSGTRDTLIYLKGDNLRVVNPDGTTEFEFSGEVTDYSPTNTIGFNNKEFMQIEGTTNSNGEFGIAFGGRGIGFDVVDSLTEIKTFGNTVTDFQTFDQTDFTTVPNAIPASLDLFLIEGSTAFNDPAVSNWQGFAPRSLWFAFAGCSSFNQDLSNWNTSRVENFQAAFKNATAFNGDITAWDTTAINNTSYNTVRLAEMFYGANAFNRDISSWDVSNCLSFESMFREAVNFNQDISSWDVSAAENMDFMFLNADNFNQPIGVWDTTKVLSMSAMFGNADSAGSFNQDLSGWCVEFIPSQPENFDLGQPNWTQPKPSWGGICGTVFATRDVDSVLSTTEYKYGSGSLESGTLQMSNQVLNYQQSPFTIEFWSKGQKFYSSKVVAQNKDRGNSFFVDFNEGIATFTYAWKDYNDGLIEEGVESFTSDDNSSDSTSWKHYAFVVDFGNEFVKIFIDGVLIDNHTVVKGADSGNPDDYTIDSLYPADDLSEVSVDSDPGSLLDNLRISNGTRYSANFTPGELVSDSNTVVLLNFDGNIDNEA